MMSFRSSALVSLLIFSILTAPIASYADEELNSFPADSPFALLKKPQKKRNVFWPPLVSLILPGFDQYLEKQWPWAATYTSTAVVGNVFGLAMYPYDQRASEFGIQLGMAAGGYSAYHSFRTAVRSRKSMGEYAFIKTEETPFDLWLSPFRFDYLARWSTLVPIGLALFLLFAAPPLFHDKVNYNHLKVGDVAFSTGTSYLAGTWEESVFRGWLYPVGVEYIGSPFVSNILTSGLFAAAHIGNTDTPTIPWPQFLFGCYLAAIASKNDYAISEGIFIHAWWDLIILTASYAAGNGRIAFQLPPLSIAF